MSRRDPGCGYCGLTDHIGHCRSCHKSLNDPGVTECDECIRTYAPPTDEFIATSDPDTLPQYPAAIPFYDCEVG